MVLVKKRAQLLHVDNGNTSVHHSVSEQASNLFYFLQDKLQGCTWQFHKTTTSLPKGWQFHVCQMSLIWKKGSWIRKKGRFWITYHTLRWWKRGLHIQRASSSKLPFSWMPLPSAMQQNSMLDLNWSNMEFFPITFLNLMLTEKPHTKI